MAFAALLDTCTLYPAHLRDTLLRLAERGLYRPLWSPDILEELHRNLVEDGYDRTKIDRLVGEMRTHFADAEIHGYDELVDAMTCDPKDRHVLAAAVRADAAAIVTHNVSDFPSHSVTKYAIEVITPDDFLLDQLDLAPRVVMDVLAAQVRAHRREPTTLVGLIDALELAGAPAFADELRRRTA